MPRAASAANTLPPEEFLSSQLAEAGGALPALAVSVIKDGEVVFRRVEGLRKLGSDDRVTTDDAFHIGSDTKAMTALLCGIFVDRALLSWKSTIGSVFVDDLAYRGAYRGVTLEELLSHTAGLPPGLPGPVWAGFFPYDSPAGRDRARMAAESLALKPSSPPGSSYAYSNLGYVVAGHMLERVSGKSWEELMRKELFAPLGMEEAGFGPPARPLDSGETRPAPWGHSPKAVDPASAVADNPAALGPAGTVHASLGDLERYVSLYLRRGLGPTGARIASESSLEELMRPRKNGYALGWGAGRDASGRRYIVHEGSNTMFYCTIVILPDDSAAVIALTNRGDGPAAQKIGEIVAYLAERFLGAREL